MSHASFPAALVARAAEQTCESVRRKISDTREAFIVNAMKPNFFGFRRSRESAIHYLWEGESSEVIYLRWLESEADYQYDRAMKICELARAKNRAGPNGTVELSEDDYQLLKRGLAS